MLRPKSLVRLRRTSPTQAAPLSAHTASHSHARPLRFALHTTHVNGAGRRGRVAGKVVLVDGEGSLEDPYNEVIRVLLFGAVRRGARLTVLASCAILSFCWCVAASSASHWARRARAVSRSPLTACSDPLSTAATLVASFASATLASLSCWSWSTSTVAAALCAAVTVADRSNKKAHSFFTASTWGGGEAWQTHNAHQVALHHRGMTQV
eukprot:1193020-Prorocentrum_minimum.AAC.2